MPCWLSRGCASPCLPNWFSLSSATEELKVIFEEHRADAAARKAAHENGNGTSSKVPEPMVKAEGIVGTHGTNGTAMGRRSTRKRFLYPKATQVRVGRAMGDVKREDSP